jgi:hypothetical protein
MAFRQERTALQGSQTLILKHELQVSSTSSGEPKRIYELRSTLAIGKQQYRGLVL